MVSEREIRTAFERSLDGIEYLCRDFDVNSDLSLLFNIIFEDGYLLETRKASPKDRYIEISLRKESPRDKKYLLSFRAGYFDSSNDQRRISQINARIIRNPHSLLHGSRLRIVPPN